MEVDFYNVENEIIQEQLCRPGSLLMKPDDLDMDRLAPDRTQKVVTRYACAMVDMPVSALVDDAEREYGDPYPRGINRGNLIIVDGKTVEEIMHEHFLASGDRREGYPAWYQRNCRQMTNDIVSAGLMADKRVEVFMPDEQGRLPKEPTQLTKTGYTPSPVKKVVLNLWEQHFAKHGFYKEKAAKAAEYRKIMDARERVSIRYTSAMLDKINPSTEMGRLFGAVNIFAEAPEAAAKAGYTPTMPGTACTCYMLGKGFKMEDIIDPLKLQEERKEAGQEYLRHMKSGDSAWLGEQLYNGGKLLKEEYEKLPQTLDLTDRSVLAENVRYLTIGQNALTNVLNAKNGSSRDSFRAAAAADQGKNAAEYCEKTDKEIVNMVSTLNALGAGERARTELISGYQVGPNSVRSASATAALVEEAAVRKEYHDAHIWKRPLSQAADAAKLSALHDHLMESKGLPQVAAKLAGDSRMARRLAFGSADGRTLKLLEFKTVNVYGEKRKEIGPTKDLLTPSSQRKMEQSKAAKAKPAK